MPTLSAMFKLMDGYSSQINRMIDRTDAAMTKMLRASKAVDGLGDSTEKTGKKTKESIPGNEKYSDGLKGMSKSADRASSSLKRLIGAMVGVASMKKGMDVTDTYMNTSARLGMITGSDSEKAALQQDIFAAAGRSRGDYIEMANAAAKLKMLAGDSFGSNQEAVGFTELLTKSLKVSGARQAEQNSAFLQLAQAMTSGRLQGDEFRSVMENAPMVADAIALYMGKSKTELKELSSQGLITSDIIKNAMFQAAGDINDKFDSMPVTFADTWSKIKNTGMQAFGDIMTRVNGLLNSDMGQAVVNNLTGAIYMAAGAADALLDGLEWIGYHMDVITPLVFDLVSAYAAYNAVLGITNALIGVHKLKTDALAAAQMMQSGVTFSATAAQYGFNAALLACPVTWIVGGLILLVALFYAGVAAVNHFAGTSVSATGLIGAAFYTAWAFIYNTFLYPMQVGFVLLANLVGNVFNNPTAAVKIMFLDMANACVGYILNMARAIEAIINKIPGVTVDITSGLDRFKAGLEEKTSAIKDESGWQEYAKQPELLDYGKMAAKGYQAGSSLGSKASGFLSSFNPAVGSGGIDFGGLGSAGAPATVKGTGKGGAVKVESEEDLEWMRRLAERDYVARIAQNTLAPNIRVEFSGPITKEADTDKVMSRVVEQLRDVIDSAPEGVPA